MIILNKESVTLKSAIRLFRCLEILVIYIQRIIIIFWCLCITSGFKLNNSVKNYEINSNNDIQFKNLDELGVISKYKNVFTAKYFIALVKRHQLKGVH